MPWNGCSTATLGSSQPKSGKDCASDKSFLIGTKCCMVSVKTPLPYNFCSFVPTEQKLLETTLKTWTQFMPTVDCASSFIAKSIIALFGFLLLTF